MGAGSTWIDAELLRNIDNLRETLEKFCDTFERKGLALLEKMHIPQLKIYPSKEIHKYVYENKELIYNRYLDKAGFPLDGYREAYIKIAGEISCLKDKSFDEEVKNRLIELAVALGEIIRRRFGWKWKWIKRQNRVCLTSKTNRFRDDPLLSVFTAYSHPQIEFFIEHYESYENRYGG